MTPDFFGRLRRIAKMLKLFAAPDAGARALEQRVRELLEAALQTGRFGEI